MSTRDDIALERAMSGRRGATTRKTGEAKIGFPCCLSAFGSPVKEAMETSYTYTNEMR